MEPLKRLLSTHPQIFLLLGIALILDLSGVMSSIMPGTSFALGSVFVVAYFLGVSGILRFAIARRPIDLSITWFAIVILYLGWFGIQAALNERPYRPSLLFFLSVVSAFKMMRFRDTPTTTAAETSPASEKRDETTEPDCPISSDDLPPPIPPELRHASRPSAGRAWDRVTVKPNQLLPLLLGFLICTVVILGVALGWEINQRKALENQFNLLNAAFAKSDAEYSDIRVSAYDAVKFEVGLRDEVRAMKEDLSKKIQTLFHQDVISSLERVRKYQQLERNFDSISGYLENKQGIRWTPLKDQTSASLNR